MDMSLYEYQDLIIGQSSVIISQFTFVISLFTGYLAVAYLVGKKLTRLQLAVVSGAYVPIAFFASMALIGEFRARTQLRLDMYAAYEVGTSQNAGPGPTIVLGTILVGCIAASLLFMHHVRRSKVDP